MLLNNTPATIAIGIDPGASGAIAAIDLTTGDAFAIDIPTRTIRSRSGRTKPILDHDELIAVTRHHWGDARAIATVENPSSFRQGSVGAATFAANISACITAMAAIEVPRLLVAPLTWKRAMGLSSNKAASIAVAGRYFPFADLGTKATADRAEALLIALYGVQIAPSRFIAASAIAAPKTG